MNLQHDTHAKIAELHREEVYHNDLGTILIWLGGTKMRVSSEPISESGASSAASPSSTDAEFTPSSPVQSRSRNQSPASPPSRRSSVQSFSSVSTRATDGSDWSPSLSRQSSRSSLASTDADAQNGPAPGGDTETQLANIMTALATLPDANTFNALLSQYNELQHAQMPQQFADILSQQNSWNPMDTMTNRRADL